MKKLFAASALFWALALFWSKAAQADAQAHWLAAAGKADITPDLAQESVWLAGYGPMGRKAIGVHDRLYARALVLSDGRKTVALVSVDSIGLFRNDILAMRAAANWGDPEHYLFISAIHSHSTPDSMGFWGPFPGVSGVNAQYRKRVIAAVASLVRNLDQELKPATLSAASSEINPKNLCRDDRDPAIIDPELDVVQARDFSTPPNTIGTLVRWSCHATVLGYTNHEISADYPGALCRRMEQDTGGACVFENGIIGGHLNPETASSGEPPAQLKGLARLRQQARLYFSRSAASPVEVNEMERIGNTLAADALTAIAHGEKIPQASISFSSRTLLIPVENSRYLLMLPALTFGHRLLGVNGNPLPRWADHWLPLKHLLFFPLPAYEEPRVETEVSLIRLGSVEILGVPGELFPELAIGGYDGRYRFGHPLIKSGNPNPPDLSQAPQGPYLRQEMNARVGIIVGLADDELGYVVPNYDFRISDTRLMLPGPPGDHYEETNSIGPSITPILLNAYRELLAPQAPADPAAASRSR